MTYTAVSHQVAIETLWLLSCPPSLQRVFAVSLSTIVSSIYGFLVPQLDRGVILNFISTVMIIIIIIIIIITITNKLYLYGKKRLCVGTRKTSNQ